MLDFEITKHNPPGTRIQTRLQPSALSKFSGNIGVGVGGMLSGRNRDGGIGAISQADSLSRHGGKSGLRNSNAPTHKNYISNSVDFSIGANQRSKFG